MLTLLGSNIEHIWWFHIDTLPNWAYLCHILNISHLCRLQSNTNPKPHFHISLPTWITKNLLAQYLSLSLRSDIRNSKSTIKSFQFAFYSKPRVRQLSHSYLLCQHDIVAMRNAVLEITQNIRRAYRRIQVLATRRRDLFISQRSRRKTNWWG